MFEALAEEFMSEEFMSALGTAVCNGVWVLVAIVVLAAFLMFASGGFGGSPIEDH